MISSGPEGMVSLEFVKSDMLNEKMRKKCQDISSTSYSEALVSKSRGISKSKGPDSNRDKNTEKHKGRYEDSECYHYGNKCTSK